MGDRCLIISTHKYKEEEVKEIVRIRSLEEDVELTEEALSLLAKIGMETSLRYALQMIATSAIVCRKRKVRLFHRLGFDELVRCCARCFVGVLGEIRWCHI